MSEVQLDGKKLHEKEKKTEDKERKKKKGGTKSMEKRHTMMMGV